jgi:hypothetical protein
MYTMIQYHMQKMCLQAEKRPMHVPSPPILKQAPRLRHLSHYTDDVSQLMLDQALYQR